MRELALFAGAGGGLLASTYLLGWDTVCGVEIDEHCRAVLMQRQRDGVLPFFPLWDDIRTFDGRPWRGHVDVVSGGFPCQAFSTAARGRNTAPDLWPDMFRVVREIQPATVFAENVQAAPILRACADLTRAGYSALWCKLSAADLGAPHRRTRFWLVAHANSCGEPRCSKHAEAHVPRQVAGVDWWNDDAIALGISNGVANRVERMRCLGNGQVPAVAAFAFNHLSAKLLT